MNPAEEHAKNVEDYQEFLKGDDCSGGATLTFNTLNPPLTVDCRFDRIIDNFDLNNGQVPKMIVEGCKFLAQKIPFSAKPSIRKGLPCILKPNPTAENVELRLDIGGLVSGGLEYFFTLYDRNFDA